jgi:hypothetical protein
MPYLDGSEGLLCGRYLLQPNASLERLSTAAKETPGRPVGRDEPTMPRCHDALLRMLCNNGSWEKGARQLVGPRSRSWGYAYVYDQDRGFEI